MEVVQEQAEILGIELPKSLIRQKDSKEYKKEKERLLEAVKYSMEFYHNNLLKTKKRLNTLKKKRCQ